MPTQPESTLHRRLHEQLKLGSKPLVDSDGAWQAFPQLTGAEKLHSMRVLFAEEALVLAATWHVQSTRQETRPPAELKRAALRRLIQSALPEAWRYFGVNNYREIANLMPETWVERIAELEHLRPDASQSCDDERARLVEDPFHED